MKVEVKDKSSIEKIISVEVEPERYQGTLEKSIKSAVKNVQVPGFRRGKAPKAAVLRLVGMDALKQDLLRDLVPEIALEIVKEKKIVPLSAPVLNNFDEIQLEEGKPINLEISFEVKPEFDLDGYKGLDLIKIVREVDVDKMTQDQINALLERSATMIPVEEDRAIQEGDVGHVNFESFLLDGTPVKGGSAKDYYMSMDDKSFIPGFMQKIIGKKAGDKWDFEITFPEEYGDKNLAGQKVRFNMELHAIMKKELPKRDEEFAKSVGEYASFEELEADMKGKIEDQIKQQQTNEMREQSVAKLVEKIKHVAIPNSLVKMHLENLLQNLDQQLRMMGQTLDSHLKNGKQSAETLMQQYYPRAKNNAAASLILDKIAQIENIEATNEDITAEIEKMAKQMKRDPEIIRKAMERDEYLPELKYEIRNRKVFDLILDNATISEKSPQEVLADTRAKMAAKSEELLGETKKEEEEKPAETVSAE